MRYRDYYSLKTLHRFDVNPDKSLPTEGSAEEVKTEMMSAFSPRTEEDRAFLSHKTDCAVNDLRLNEPVFARERVEVAEAVETVPGLAELADDGVPVRTAERTL